MPFGIIHMPRRRDRSRPGVRRLVGLIVAGLLAAVALSARAADPPCSDPLPTVPAADARDLRFSDVDGRPARARLWRYTCTTDFGSRHRLVARLEPLQPGVRLGRRLISAVDNQQGWGFSTSLEPWPDDRLSEIPLVEPTTYEIDNGITSTGDSVTLDGAITLVFGGSNGTPVMIALPAMGAAVASTPRLTGRLSGAYFDPARSGEGLLVDVSEAAHGSGTSSGATVAFGWFTYDDAGGQRWFVGNSIVRDEVAAARMNLIDTRGGRFGSAFDPRQVEFRVAGTAALHWTDCRHLSFDWALADGSQGSVRYERIGESLENLSCE